MEVKAGVERRWSRPGAAPEVEARTLPLIRVEGSRAAYEGILTQTPEGEYRFWLTSPPQPDGKPQVACTVLPPPGEMDRVRMNQPELERAAETSKGRLYTMAEAERLLDDLPLGTRVIYNSPQQPRLLWNHSLVFALALWFLGLEWFLRKQRHLV
jgi:hypothetical protein